MSSSKKQARINALSKLSDALESIGEELEALPEKISSFIEAIDDHGAIETVGPPLRNALRRADLLVAEILAGNRTLNNSKGGDKDNTWK